MELTPVSDPFSSTKAAPDGFVPTADPFGDFADSAPVPTTEEVTPKTVKFNIGQTEIEIPDVPDDQRGQIIDNFRQTPEFDALVDKETGASNWARSIVGSSPEQDRLANIKQFYPDAVPYGDDNFVFTNPETGEPTLYNPEGLDVGDVFSVGREASQAIGSGLGAVLAGGSALVAGQAGPQVLLPEELVTVPAAAAFGAGVGNETGAALFDAAFSLFSDRIDTRTLGERTIDVAEGGLAAASGQRIGDLAGPVIAKAGGKIASNSKQAAAELFEQFKRLKIDAPAGAVTTRKSIQTVEKSLEAAPMSADIMQENAEKVITQTQTAAEKIAREFGSIKTKEGAGAVIKDAAVRAAERFGFRKEKLYDDAFDLVGEGTFVTPDAVRTLQTQMLEDLSKAPNALKATLSPVLKQIDAIMEDADSGLPFDALRQVRTIIGRDLKDPILVGGSSSQNVAKKRLYGALTEDMSATAQAAGSEAAKKLAVADRFTRHFMNTASKTFNKIANFEADEHAYNFALQASKDGGSALMRLRKHFEPDEWDVVAGTVLGRMGLAKPGAQNATGDAFSVSTFLTSWNTIAPEAKQALFGGNRYKDLAPALDDLVSVIGSLKNVERLTNHSHTARAMISFATISTLGGSIGALTGGDVASGGLGTAASVVGGILAPRYAAKLITNPKFVKWLATPITEHSQIPNHLGRLVGVMADEPGMEEAVREFIQVVATNPAYASDSSESSEVTEDPEQAMSKLPVILNGISKLAKSWVKSRAKVKRGDDRFKRTNGGEFVQFDDGKIEFGKIDPETAAEIGFEAATIRLRKGKHDSDTNKGEGYDHIEARHGEQIRSIVDGDGSPVFEDVAEYVDFVSHNWTEIRDNGRGRLVMIVRDAEAERSDDTQDLMILELEKDPAATFYDVKTAGPFRNRSLKSMELLTSR